MRTFELLREHDHEQVVYLQDRTLGLRCIVAIHSTALGPALGGLRMWPYASEAEALQDALRLARGMTYKAAVSGLNFGGGKAVLIGDPETGKSEALLRALGRHIGALGGRFIVAEDIGTNADDMEVIREETNQVVGVHRVDGGSGDPSPFTALGAIHGFKACLQKRFGYEDLSRATYAVQGAGQVGRHLVRLLREQGAKVFVADINEQRIEEVVDESGAEAVPMSQIYDVDATVFAPCAMGAVINEDTVPRLQCAIVAGCANNQLESNECGTALEGRGILYAPDYAINAGGLINSAVELQGYDADRALQRVSRIRNVIQRVFEIAAREHIPTWQAADRMAEERIRSISHTRQTFTSM
jgi:leucine dehydrogenase